MGRGRRSWGVGREGEWVGGWGKEVNLCLTGIPSSFVGGGNSEIVHSPFVLQKKMRKHHQYEQKTLFFLLQMMQTPSHVLPSVTSLCSSFLQSLLVSKQTPQRYQSPSTVLIWPVTQRFSWSVVWPILFVSFVAVIWLVTQDFSKALRDERSKWLRGTRSGMVIWRFVVQFNFQGFLIINLNSFAFLILLRQNEDDDENDASENEGMNVFCFCDLFIFALMSGGTHI